MCICNCHAQIITRWVWRITGMRPMGMRSENAGVLLQVRMFICWRTCKQLFPRKMPHSLCENRALMTAAEQRHAEQIPADKIHQDEAQLAKLSCMILTSVCTKRPGMCVKKKARRTLASEVRKPLASLASDSAYRLNHVKKQKRTHVPSLHTTPYLATDVQWEWRNPS